MDFAEHNYADAAVDLAEQLDDVPLMIADVVLDDVRRYLWLRQFSGASKQALILGMTTEETEQAIQIANSLDGSVTLNEAEEIIHEARAIMWGATFSQIPRSHFAKSILANAGKKGESVH
ncbi:hypothetical protein [Thalassospira profundimaris]|uniref:Uncharacterized protein n=1 Tax=Thalassospira profundimaris TaxID=502049 RepID=A0A367WN05_9PROT|nr:hypothetical protein [Thalassospira profundimaris]RCK41960.1 hypothetical protein TH30_21380 [Thalassospira profundimaris]